TCDGVCLGSGALVRVAVHFSRSHCRRRRHGIFAGPLAAHQALAHARAGSHRIFRWRARSLTPSPGGVAMDAKAAEPVAPATGEQTERRIGWLTLLFGFAAAAIAAALRHNPWAAGLAIGTALGWLNFRWLKRAVDTLVVVSTAQKGGQAPRVPITAYLAALFSHGLLGFTVYVIFIFLHVPLGSMVLGFCALAAAAIAASAWEILNPAD